MATAAFGGPSFEFGRRSYRLGADFFMRLVGCIKDNTIAATRCLRPSLPALNDGQLGGSSWVRIPP